jgi:imidazolonepropionase-like amidohydrolase
VRSNGKADPALSRPGLGLLSAPWLLYCVAVLADERAVNPAVAAPASAPVAVACPDGTASSRAYVVELMGNRAGFQTVCVQPDGVRVVHYAFNDRGRGPALTSRLQLNAQGIPVAVTTDGVDYLKGAVGERFSLAAGRASWTNKVEQGSVVTGNEPAFYVSQAATHEESGLLARALRKAPGNRLRLLPQGEAHADELLRHELKGQAGSQTLTLHAISGLGFQPVSIWLDADGELFAALDGFSAVYRAGSEAALAELRTVQEAQEGLRRSAQAAALRRVPAGAVVIEHARLFDPTSMSLQPDTTVVFERRRIVAVGRDGKVSIPAGAERIDAAGRTLLPGLWDMHTHPDLDSGPLFLAAGVTSVRDMAAEPDKPAKLRAFDAGTAIGPRVVFAGIIDGRGPFQAPTKVLANNELEARTAVQAMRAAGFGLVKIYSSLDPALVPVVASEAHAAGMRVGGHVPAQMTAERAVRAGYDEIQHMNMLFLNFLFDVVQDTRTPARFTAVAEHAASIDPQSVPVQAFLALLRERGVTVDPTLTVFESLFEDRPGVVGAGMTAVADRMPPLVRRGLLEGGLPVPAGSEQRYRAALPQMQRMLVALRAARVPFVAGTDGMPGFTLPRELELYVAAGVPAPEVLRIATLDAARHAGREAELGSIMPGKLADMILVEGDPTRTIGDVRRVRLVIKDGALFDPDELCRSLGIQPLAAASR